jgi:hypothetical protein
MPRTLITILGALISFTLFKASGDFGPVAVAINLFVPLAPAYVGMRFGVPSGAAAVFVAAALLLVSAGFGAAATYTLQFGIMAALLPWFLQKFGRWDRAVASTLVVVIAMTLLGLSAYAAVQNKGPVSLAGEIIEEEVARASAFMDSAFSESSSSPEAVAELGAAVDRMADFMRRVYPGMVVLVSGLLLLALTGFLTAISKGYYRMPGPTFAEWKAPEVLVWVLIVCGFTVVFATGTAQTVALNLLVVLLPVYFLQGLAVIDHFFRRKAFSPVLRVLGYMMVTLVNPLPMFVAGIGVFDLWIDFRKPREQTN